MSLSPLRYPGGKSRLAKQIADLIVPSLDGRRYCEPFLGGGSVALEVSKRLPVFDAILNDADPGIACLWNAAIFNTDDLIEAVRAFTPSVRAFERFKKSTGRGLVERGFRKLALHAMSYSGLGAVAGGPIGGVSQSSKWGVGCRWNPASIERKVRYIRSAFSDPVLDLSALDIVAGLPEESFAYLDPPYYLRGDDLYLYSMSPGEHRSLADMLRHARFTWLLSYDDCDEVRGMYAWADIKEVDVTYTICSGSRGSGRRTRELLISPG